MVMYLNFWPSLEVSQKKEEEEEEELASTRPVGFAAGKKRTSGPDNWPNFAKWHAIFD